MPRNPKMTYEVSDGLFNFRRFLDEFEDTGVTLDGPTVRELRRQIKELGIQASALENEVSRHRWNSRADDDAHDATLHAVGWELAKPETNLVLFPSFMRQFSDGRRGDRP